jgi:Zn-dependent protease
MTGCHNRDGIEGIAMLLEPGPSPYDLNFRLFGTPVRVAPWFWLVSAIFGWKFAERLGLAYLGLWIACAFFSILLHEFGHVWAGRAFGSDGSIVLYSFGGLAIGSNDVRQRWERIVVSLAGPGIQLALYGALKLAEYRMGEKGFDDLPPALQITLGMLMWINLFWPLFNLMPVWPLDGGMVTREICTGLSRQNGLQISLRISFAAALLLAEGQDIERVAAMLNLPQTQVHLIRDLQQVTAREKRSSSRPRRSEEPMAAAETSRPLKTAAPQEKAAARPILLVDAIRNAANIPLTPEPSRSSFKGVTA